VSWKVDECKPLVIGIYGSKELFINEYRNMLAERLLSKVGPGNLNPLFLS